MRRSLLAPLGAVVLLSLAAASAHAATPDTTVAAPQTTATTTTSGASTTPFPTVPTACQSDDLAASATPPLTTGTTVTTPVAVTGVATADDVKSDDGEGQDHRIGACIQALRDADERGFGAIVSALAHEEARDRREKRDGDDSDPPVAVPSVSPSAVPALTSAMHPVPSTTPVVSGTPSSKLNAEHQGQSDHGQSNNPAPHADDHGHGGDR